MIKVYEKEKAKLRNGSRSAKEKEEKSCHASGPAFKNMRDQTNSGYKSECENIISV